MRQKLGNAVRRVWCFFFGHKLKDILSHVYCTRCNKTWTFLKLME